ncbi:hypothetical protein G6F35_017652 [Rhizopus arrhizus]|nr:hypothetical protein G6F24_017765 [Rhizopus arrhizus]KAG1167688.1 hypothetical protein G6F35_017652 [Rhizopus arrhizus]
MAPVSALAGGAVARLDGHAVQYGRVEGREALRVGAGRQLALPDARVQSGQDAALHLAAVVAQEAADAGVVDAARRRAQHDHAARRQAGRGEAFGGGKQHGLDAAAGGGRVLQRAPGRSAFRFTVELDRFTK